jgi:signal transduction histidine kinase
MTDARITINSAENLNLLYQLSSRLAISFDLPTVMEQILGLAGEYLETDRGSLVILDKGEPVDAALMFNDRIMYNNVATFADVLKRGLVSWVIDHHQAAFVNNTVVDPRWLKRTDDQPDQTGPKSAMCFPLIAEQNLFGVLTIVHAGPDHFTQDQFAFLQVAAETAAIAIRNSLRNTKLTVQQNHYYHVFDDHICPNVVTTSNGDIIEANQAALDLLKMDQYFIRGKSMYELHQAPFHILGDSYDHLILGQTETYEAALHPQEGSAIQARISVRMLPHDASGNLLWLIEDISEEKQMLVMREDMSAMIYHDIRSPLANVISSLELLKVMLPDQKDENIDEVLSVISRSTNRVQRLVSNLLDIGRLENEHRFVEFEEIDVRDLITSVVSDVQPIMDSRRQVFESLIGDTVQDVWGDEDMLKRVLINLLENAAKYSPMEEKIIFNVSRLDSGALRFVVEDHGPGIPEDQLQHIFEKFTRVSNRKGPKGIGLGLAFCKMAVDAHGGEIWAESDGNTGTRFIFDLPNQSRQP